MDIILSFPSLNKGYHYKNFPMNDLKKKFDYLCLKEMHRDLHSQVMGFTDVLNCILLLLYLRYYFCLKRKAIFKSKVKNYIYINRYVLCLVDHSKTNDFIFQCPGIKEAIKYMPMISIISHSKG